MNKSILSFLNVRREEETQVILMLTVGFFMGIFLATYQVTAESLFINKLKGHQLPFYELTNAVLASGVLGILVTMIFSYAQNRVRFSSLTIVSILMVVLTSTGLYVVYHADPNNEIQHEIVLFVMFCLVGPITALLLLCYWGVFGRLFNFKQSKRIIGWIDTGQLIAQILAYFVIPLTSAFFVDTSNYLIICNISILCALVFLIVISVRFTLTKNNPAEFDKSVLKETQFSRIFRDRYVILLSVFIIISMIVYVLSQFSFQTLLNQQYPDQRELTNFLAYFMGASFGLSLVMQTFVNDRILSNYGIKVSLYVLPVVVGLFVIGSLLAGGLLGSSLAASSNFIFFFLFVALTRLFNGTLRDSLENPVFKLLFIPLDNRYRFGIQAKVEGVVNESGRFIAGLMIFLVAMVPAFQIIWVPAIILLLLGIYMMVSSQLYAGYRNKIRSKLEHTDEEQEKLEIGFTQITARLESLLASQKTSRAVFSFKLLEKIKPSMVPLWVNSLMKNDHEEAQDYAQRRMNEIKGLSVSERYIIKMSKSGDGSDKNVLSKFDLQQIIDNGGDITKARIQKLCRSSVVEDRQYAGELLLHTSSEENISFLIELLNDPESKVRQTAIQIASKKHSQEVIFALIDNLGNPIFSNQVMNSLVLIGGKALNQLDNSFYRSGQSTQILLRIIQTIGRIGGQRARDLLWNKIDYPDKVVVSQVLLSMGECGFKAGISQITRIKYAIESDIADISWNLGAVNEVGDDVEFQEVRQALLREIQNDTEHIYMLLAMLYDTRSIQLVKENIESGTAEGTTYAVELLDVFLSEQLKQRVIPVLDELTVTEKISRLEAFYPRIRLDQQLVLKFLINRDFTQANRWTKACVLHQIGQLRIAAFSLDLIAQLFNPDPLIREVAGWALYMINPDSFRANIQRLDEQIRRRLEEVVIDQGALSSLMVYEKVRFFMQIPVFEGIPGITLSFLANISEETRLKDEESLSIDEKFNNNFYVIYSGAVRYYSKSEYKGDFEKGQFIGEMLSAAGFANTNLIVAREETVLLKISKELFYELVSDNVKLADKVLEYI